MKRRARKVAVLGSSGFPLSVALGAAIVDLLRELPPNTVLLTRGRGNVDEFVAAVAIPLGLRCFTYPSQGLSDNWQRDVDLARDADEAIVIVASDTLRETNSGTEHVLTKLLDFKKTVRAYTEVDDRLVFAGATGDG